MRSFDPQPTLVGPAIRLRPLQPADFDALYVVAADPLVWALHPAHDRWQPLVFEGFFADALASGGALVAIDAATGAIIGSSRYDGQRAEPGEIEIGWTFLARSHWGGGVNAEMKRLMIGHALAHHSRVMFMVGEANVRSRRALEKIGGVLTDRRPVVSIGAQLVSHAVYTIDRAGFGAGPLQS